MDGVSRGVRGAMRAGAEMGCGAVPEGICSCSWRVGSPRGLYFYGELLGMTVLSLKYHPQIYSMRDVRPVQPARFEGRV